MLIICLRLGKIARLREKGVLWFVDEDLLQRERNGVFRFYWIVTIVTRYIHACDSLCDVALVNDYYPLWVVGDDDGDGDGSVQIDTLHV